MTRPPSRAFRLASASTIYHLFYVSWLRLLVALKLRALVNPRIAADLTVLWWRYRRRRWWTRFPFIPWPDREYLRWRMYTAYGAEDALPPVADVLRYARWARRYP